MRVMGWYSRPSTTSPLETRGQRPADHRRGQHLDRDLPLQVRVGRAIDLAHATDANLGGDFVRAEAGACVECHE